MPSVSPHSAALGFAIVKGADQVKAIAEVLGLLSAKERLIPGGCTQPYWQNILSIANEFANNFGAEGKAFVEQQAAQ